MKIGSSICLFSDGVILVDCGEGTRWRKDEKLRIDSTLILLLLLDPAINEKTINEMRCYILYTGTVLSQTHKSQVSLLNKRTPATTRRTPHRRHSAWSRRVVVHVGGEVHVLLLLPLPVRLPPPGATNDTCRGPP
jgi:hypothetical protein